MRFFIFFLFSFFVSASTAVALASGPEGAVFHFSSICSCNERQVSSAINTESGAGALTVWRPCPCASRLPSAYPTGVDGWPPPPPLPPSTGTADRCSLEDETEAATRQERITVPSGSLRDGFKGAAVICLFPSFCEKKNKQKKRFGQSMHLNFIGSEKNSSQCGQVEA